MRSLPPAPSSGKSSGGVSFLRCLALLFLMVTTVGLLSQQAQAADVPTGTIEGRVLNLSNGRYLSKALVKVEGTTIETLTNDFGEYTLREVPAGPVKVTVFYTGQEPKTVDVAVEAGKTVEKDMGLSQSKELAEDGTVVLDAYVVAQQRYKNAQEIAINEERNSANIKSVVAADSLGHIPDGNVGEFVRFMPGIDVTYGGTYVNGADAYQISVRGFGPEDTAIMIDGMPVSSPSPASLTRAVGLDMISINNASRIEVTKVPTPDMPADSPGGSVNLITRSAFEYAKPEYKLEASITFNTMDTTIFSKKPGPANKETYHALPGARASVVIPINKDMGLSVSIASDNKFQPNQTARFNQVTVGPVTIDRRAVGGAQNEQVLNAGGRPGISNPFVNRFQVYDYPWNTFKQSGNIRFDWRPFSGLKLATNFQYSQYTGINVSRRLQFGVTRPADWGTDYVIGTQYTRNGSFTMDGGNSIAQTIDARDKVGSTKSGYIKLDYQKGGWTIGGSASRSFADGHYDDLKRGHFSGLDLSLANVGKIDFLGVKNGYPAGIAVRDRNGNVLDYTRMSNWNVDNAATLDAKSGEAFQRDVTDNFNFDVRRELDFLPWVMAVKTGWARQSKDQKKWGRGTGYKTRYVGASQYGVVIDSAAVTDDSYEVSPGFGYAPQQWADVYKLYNIYQAHPEYFDENIIIQNQTGNYTSQINQTKKVKETSDSFYGMLESKFFKNRLTVVAGARQKFSKVAGYQPYVNGGYLYLRNPDGSVYYDPVYLANIPINGDRFNGANRDGSGALIYNTDGTVNRSYHYYQTTVAGVTPWSTDTALLNRIAAAGITLPAPRWARNATNTGYLSGTPGTVEGTPGNNNTNLDLAMLRNTTRSLRAKRTDPATPSFVVAYKVSDSLDLKVSWSRETKLPDLESGADGGGYISSVQTSLDTNTNVTTFTVANPGLKPERTNSYNIALGYYNKSGGSISVSGYYKEIENEWEALTWDATTEPGLSIARDAGVEPTGGDVVKTTINGEGTSRKRGLEIEIRQNLSVLGSWASGVDMFATYTYKTHGSLSTGTSTLNALPGKSQDKYSGGLSYSNKRLTIQARGTYATDTYKKTEASTSTINAITPAGTPVYISGTATQMKYQIYDYTPVEYRVNVEAYYRFTKNLSWFASVSDAIRSPIRRKTWDIGSDQIPENYRTWATINYGATITTGVSASF